MRFASFIRTRLWLTYAMIILMVLLIAIGGILISFRKSPLLYRQIFYRISLVDNFLADRLSLVIDTQWEPIIQFFFEEVEILDVRVAIQNKEGEILFHSEVDKGEFPIPAVENPENFSEKNKERILIYQDKDGEDWFYQISPINSMYFLITTAHRPPIPISTLLQDELMRPLLNAGMIAMVSALVIGFFIAEWITQPLQEISSATEKIPMGKYQEIPIKGPSEVRNLAKTINEMNRQVNSAIQAQQDFVANVSHEFKTPLTSIQGFAQAVYEGAVETEEDQKRAAGIILEETERLNHLVSDLLTLSKLDSGVIELDIQSIDPNSLIENIIERMQFQIKAKELNIKKEFTENLIISADAEKIDRLLSNLIDNAIKFTNIGGKIFISTYQLNNEVVIKIRDTGMGIPEDELGRIFERFYRVDKSRRGDQGRGVGLGLVIANEIAKSHGGSIEVQSEVGKGSTFMVKLPSENENRQQQAY